MSVRTRLDTLEKRLFGMISPREKAVTFVFPDGHRETFKKAHDALIFAIRNPRKEDLRGVTIEPPGADSDSFLLAIMALADGIDA